MRLLALALFALCTAGVAASKVSTSCSTKSCCNARDAFRRCPVGVLGEGTATHATGVAALQAKIEALEATNAAMCAETPVGVRPAALEKVCSGAKTTDIQVFGGLGEGTLVGGCQNNQSYCTINEAKCAGTGQNNTLVEGSLDCDVDPKDADDAMKGTACIDNLSTGKAHRYLSTGKGTCKSFNSDMAIFGVTQFSSDKNTVTKMMLAHPHKANNDIGVFAMKRMLCDDGGCSVFKAGYCVKCPGNVFANKAQKMATPEELGKFFDCCVMGQSTYKNKESGNTHNCPSGWSAGAFTSPDGSPSNDPLATIHADYACTGDDAEKAMMLMKAM